MIGVGAETWLILCIALPFTLAVAAYVVGPRANLYVAWLAGLAIPLASAGLCYGVVTEGAIRYAVGGWDQPLGIALHADVLSGLMVLLSAVVGLVTCLYGHRYLGGADDASSRSYWPLWLMLWGALNALFLAGDAFNVYVTLELVTLASVGLVAMTGKAVSVRASFRYLILALAGSLAYLLGVALLYAQHGVLDLVMLGEQLGTDWASVAACAAVTVGLILKAALFPMHFWLPAAHGSAPAPVSAVLSALVVKASFYLVLRYWLDVFPASVTDVGSFVLSGLGAAAIIWGSVQALRTPRLKLLVAYSTVAQLGYLFLVLPLLRDAAQRDAVVTGLICLALAHGLAKAGAFMAAGAMQRVAGDDGMHGLRGVSVSTPVAVFAFALAGISLMGLPPAGGFGAKWVLLDASIASDNWLIAAIMLAGGLLAAGYIFRFIRVAFHTEEFAGSVVTRHRTLEWSAMALALAALLMGFLVEPISIWVANAGAAGTTQLAEVVP